MGSLAPLELHGTINVPSPVSCLAVGPNGSLALGSEDGSLRIYTLPSSRASKAIMGLGTEISSAAFSLSSSKSSESTLAGIWIAFGTEIALFDLSSEKLVLKLSDATRVLPVLRGLRDEDDVLNEIALSSKMISYTSDSGLIGVIDLESGETKEMKGKHASIAGNVSFVPDRPSELVSGGYDSTLLHFDYRLGTILSRFNLESLQSPSSGSASISLSPPFITSLAISPNGTIAAGAANGRLWVGFGGSRVDSSSSTKGKKKKRRYWEGLKDSDESVWVEVATGPVVGVQFLPSSNHILTSSLGGKLTCLRILPPSRERGQGEYALEEVWTMESRGVLKVNSMKVVEVDDVREGEGEGGADYWVVVGGLDRDGRGCVEVWKGRVG